MDREERHLPPIGISNKYARGIGGSEPSMTSSGGDSSKRLSFACISRLYASGSETVRKCGRSLRSLPGYVMPRSAFYPENVSEGCRSQHGSSGRISGATPTDVTRTDLLRRNFLRLKCSSLANHRTPVTCSCPSVASGGNVTPPTVRIGNGAPVRRPSGRIIPEAALLPKRSKSLTTVFIRVTSPPRRNSTEVTPIMEVTPVTEVGAVRELSRLTELTRLSEVSQVAPPVNGRTNGRTSSGSTESRGQSDDGVISGEGTVSEETLNKCVNWLVELEKARSNCSLDAVVETPVEWQD